MATFTAEVITPDNYTRQAELALEVISKARGNREAAAASIINKTLGCYTTGDVAKRVAKRLVENRRKLVEVCQQNGAADLYKRIKMEWDPTSTKKMIQIWKLYRDFCEKVIHQMGWEKDHELGFETNEKVSIIIGVPNERKYAKIMPDIVDLNKEFRRQIAVKTGGNIRDENSQTGGYDDDFYFKMLDHLRVLDEWGIPLPRNMTERSRSNNKPRWVNAMMGLDEDDSLHQEIQALHDKIISKNDEKSKQYKEMTAQIETASSSAQFFTNMYGNNPALSVIIFMLGIGLDEGDVGSMLETLPFILNTLGPSQTEGRKGLAGSSDPVVKRVGESLSAKSIQLHDRPTAMSYTRLREGLSCFFPMSTSVTGLMVVPKWSLLLTAWIYAVEREIHPQIYTSFKLLARGVARGWRSPLLLTAKVKQNRYIITWTVDRSTNFFVNVLRGADVKRNDDPPSGPTIKGDGGLLEDVDEEDLVYDDNRSFDGYFDADGQGGDQGGDDDDPLVSALNNAATADDIAGTDTSV